MRTLQKINLVFMQFCPTVRIEISNSSSTWIFNVRLERGGRWLVVCDICDILYMYIYIVCVASIIKSHPHVKHFREKFDENSKWNSISHEASINLSSLQEQQSIYDKKIVFLSVSETTGNRIFFDKQNFLSFISTILSFYTET